MKILGKNIKQRTYISKSLIYIFLKRYWFQKKRKNKYFCKLSKIVNTYIIYKMNLYINIIL